MLKLVTFNLRYPARQDGENFFAFRLPGILEKIREEAPDVIGFQEMREDCYAAISAMLPEYGFYGISRNADLSGESCRVAYKKDRFELAASDTFWLSDTPRAAGSRYEKQSPCPRICSYVKLWDTESKEFFYFMNTHLDHEAVEARIQGLSLIFSKAKALLAEESLPLFITGDFNCEPTEETYRLIKESGFFDLTESVAATFHGFKKSAFEKIDYILADRAYPAAKTTSWHQNAEGGYLSDHDAVAVVIDSL